MFTSKLSMIYEWLWESIHYLGLPTRNPKPSITIQSHRVPHDWGVPAQLLQELLAGGAQLFGRARGSLDFIFNREWFFTLFWGLKTHGPGMLEKWIATIFRARIHHSVWELELLAHNSCKRQEKDSVNWSTLKSALTFMLTLYIIFNALPPVRCIENLRFLMKGSIFLGQP